MSSSQPAVLIDGLSKCYHIYDRPQDRLKQAILPRLAAALGLRTQPRFFREFWAIRDVALAIGKGEVFGIVGRNGSGKSTLLQLMCGTLTPTQGSVATNGRVAALLELGAGFNPDFSGRENVFLNASLLGMSQRETEQRYDSIAEFAGIGDFMGQPVKTYSSGMYVRLAFAIATAVEPDLLIVDEALSVGDFAFQNKCMLRIRDISRRGATIVFASHDLSTLQMICDRVGWLDAGTMIEVGDPVQVCRSYYVSSLADDGGSDPARAIPQEETGHARFVEASVQDWKQHGAPACEVGSRLKIRFSLLALQPLEQTVFAVSVYRNDGDWLVGQTSREAGVFWPATPAGHSLRGELHLYPMTLAPGEYRIAITAYSSDLALCYAMTKVLPGFTVTSTFPTWGKIIHPLEWHRVAIDTGPQ